MRYRVELTLVFVLGCGGTNFTSVDAMDGSVEAGEGGSRAVSCGTQLVCMPAQACCVGQNSPPNFSCAIACPMGASALRCTRSADCPSSSVCCVHFASDTSTSVCLPSCPTGTDDAQLCDPAAMPPDCANGAMCLHDNIADWRLPQTFATCGGKKR